MTKTWYEENPLLLEEMKAEIKDLYPNLHFYLRNGIVVAQGTFPVLCGEKVIDRYSIDIVFPKHYPKSVPVVREVGGRIPKTPDRHMNNQGEACLFLSEQRWEIWPLGSTFLEFLKGPVHNFFLGQSLVEQGEAWPFGFWDHGTTGIHNYYAQLLGIEDISIIIMIVACLAKPQIKGHWDCPCGSGKRMRHCHFPLLLDLREKIPQDVARQSLTYLLRNTNPEASLVADLHSRLSI
jgi:hypothetical protein